MDSDQNNNDPGRKKRFRLPTIGITVYEGEHEYRLVELLGKGAFGTVFACTDEWGNDLVAKVVMPQNRTYEEVEQSWAQEMAMLHELRHPNITFVHNAFECDDTFYIIIERCASTIDDWLEGRGAGPRQAGELVLPRVARDILQALQYIHDSGYVHKDIHPGNVFVSLISDSTDPLTQPVIRFKVGDLGIANRESSISQTGTVLAQWMLPPENLNPDRFGIQDRRMDIYHAGLLLLFILMEKKLFFDKNDILSGEPRKLAERLHSPFGPVLAKALRRHVEDRTDSALSLWKEIDAAWGELIDSE